MTTDLDKLAAGLSELERELVLGAPKTWGSWMWGVSTDLIRKGIMSDEAPGNRQLSDLGLALKVHLTKEPPHE